MTSSISSLSSIIFFNVSLEPLPYFLTPALSIDFSPPVANAPTPTTSSASIGNKNIPSFWSNGKSFTDAPVSVMVVKPSLADPKIKLPKSNKPYLGESVVPISRLKPIFSANSLFPFNSANNLCPSNESASNPVTCNNWS